MEVHWCQLEICVLGMEERMHFSESDLSSMDYVLYFSTLFFKIFVLKSLIWFVLTSLR